MHPEKHICRRVRNMFMLSGLTSRQCGTQGSRHSLRAAEYPAFTRQSTSHGSDVIQYRTQAKLQCSHSMSCLERCMPHSVLHGVLGHCQARPQRLHALDEGTARCPQHAVFAARMPFETNLTGCQLI